MDWHTSVLLDETINGLDVHAGDVVVDATAGDGGHLRELCCRYGSNITIIGLDADGSQIERIRYRLSKDGSECNPKLIESNFRYIQTALNNDDIQLRIDKILFDLGWCAPQMSESKRGFSIRTDGPLRMSYQITSEKKILTAYDVVNTWTEENLRTIIRGYGEERFSKRIAKGICERRLNDPIRTTGDLVKVIEMSTPSWYHHRRLHPATKTFQAIRMAVNDEITALEDGLDGAFNLLNSSGRIAVISFHSLEDRIVKHRFRYWQKNGNGHIVTKKPIQPSNIEREGNPRSRSAKLRIFSKQ